MTAHWRSDRWIDLQLDRLERFVDRPHRLYANLEGVPQEKATRFDVVGSVTGRHAPKLDELAQLACAEADDDDVLLFIDGDAFPVNPVGDRIVEWLTGTPLAAIRRDENDGDPQPHPSFCVTRAGFWRSLGDAATWAAGHTWETRSGRVVSDVGGELLGALEQRGVPWRPLLRTSTHTLHPVFFGVYEHTIYHHGAGFRQPTTRVEVAEVGTRPVAPLRPDGPGPWARAVHQVRWRRYRQSRRRWNRAWAAATSDNVTTSEAVIRQLVEDPSFALTLDRTADRSDPPT